MGSSSSRALARLGLPGQPRSTWLGVAALGLAAVALGAVAWRHARPRRRRQLQQVGTVSKVWIYPIKSCKGVSVCETECTAMGLRCGKVRDRYVEPRAAHGADGPGRGRWGLAYPSSEG